MKSIAGTLSPRAANLTTGQRRLARFRRRSTDSHRKGGVTEMLGFTPRTLIGGLWLASAYLLEAVAPAHCWAVQRRASGFPAGTLKYKAGSIARCAGNRLTKGNLDMTLFHAVVWTDHRTAQVLQFDAEHVQAQKIRTHTHYTKQHGSTVRSEHEFFGEVCDALDGVAEVLLTGSHTALADFRHYADKHRPQTAARIVCIRGGRPSKRKPTRGFSTKVLSQARRHWPIAVDLGGEPAPALPRCAGEKALPMSSAEQSCRDRKSHLGRLHQGVDERRGGLSSIGNRSTLTRW